MKYIVQLLLQRSIDAVHRILNLTFTDYSMPTNAMPNIRDFMKKAPITSEAHNKSRY